MSVLAEAAVEPGAANSTATGTIVVPVVFFVSGIPALIYQLVWQRALFTMYGVNIEAVTVVVAGFLLGLGFGSLAGGQLSRPPRLNLLASFGAIELLVGGLGVASLGIVRLVGRATLHLPRAELTAVVVLLLLAPTLLMGSSLPILTAWLVRRSPNVGKSLGVLYCVNTAGAAAACFISALFLMRVAGMQGSTTAAASLNGIVGAAALAVAWRLRGCGAPRQEARVAAERPVERGAAVAPRLATAIGLAALTGYLALSYEIVWVRAFSIATNSSPAFALVLGAYLAGIANGSLRVCRLFDASWSPARALRGVARAVLAVAVTGFALLPIAAYSAASGIGYFYPMLIMIFVQATFSGTVLPLLCHYAAAPDANTGAHVSWVYAANILGSVAGTLITGFVLMNCLSIGAIAALLGASGSGIAVLTMWRGRVRGRRRLVMAVAATALFGLCAGYGVLYAGFYDRLLSNNTLSQGARFVDIVENRNGVITVDRQRNVYGNGAYDGRIEIDLMDDRNLLVRPFSLSLFHPHPRQVLMIGLGTGAWAQVIVNNPFVKHLTVVEINPGYLKIIKKYPIVANLLRNPKVEIVIDDGRRWLNRHPLPKYDAIVQNTTWYYRPNVTNLLSREYLSLAAAHLRSGGIIMYNTTDSQRAQRTACTVFPYGFREFNMMVVSPTPIVLDPERLRQTLAAYRIDGRPVLDPSDAKQRERRDAIVSALAAPPPGAVRPAAPIEDCGGVLARTRGLPLVTDDNMGEEWRSLVTTDPLLRRLRGLLGKISQNSQ